MVLTYISYFFMVVGFVPFAFILRHAFVSSTGQGFLCLCAPGYVIWYAFARFSHRRKPLIVALFLVGFALAVTLQQIDALRAGSPPPVAPP